MNEIRLKFNQLLKDFFDGETVAGAGARFGSDIPDDFRSKVSCVFDQTEVTTHPSISVRPIQVTKLDEMMDPGAGIEQFKVDVIIRAEPERQGWAICAALEKALREWIATVNHNRTLIPDGYKIDVKLGRPTSTDFVDEGNLIAYHVIVPIISVRPQEVIT